MNQSNTILLRNIAGNDADKLVIGFSQQEDAFIHDHDCFELAYVVKGSAVQTLNGVTEPVSRGAYFIIDYGSRHDYRECKELKLINCLFFPDLIDAALVDCRSFDELMRVCMIRYYKQYLGLTPVNRIFYDEDGKVLHLLEEMREEYESKNIGYQEIFRGKLLEILILTMRKVVQQHTAVSMETFTGSSVIQDAVCFLEANYADKAVLGTFCEKYHYSLQYISRRFRQETNLTALSYLQKVRIEKSCALLAGSDLSVREIARQVGYEDIKYFYRIFHRMVKMTPGEYRKTAPKVPLRY